MEKRLNLYEYITINNDLQKYSLENIYHIIAVSET